LNIINIVQSGRTLVVATLGETKFES